ncbi:PREDICTED: ATP-binding cassette sub-family D member 4-like isoform X2 [Priapulus caudatus]|uniref:ATP-binding cassette sub-family D member 4-like isoform X2 n=1 Tax=Priapulus caudatus TaxID=37621 RepID=A0ABM1DZ50_PRICU|nr:PREDICTED: ATP-binding cassette sub-family D member 4-like isoform X2 [Priapulus caudatus]
MSYKASFSFDTVFLGRFLRLQKVMFPGVTSITVLLFIFLLTILLLQEVVTYSVGLLPSRFYKVLGEKDMPGFKTELIFATILICAIAFIKSTGQYTSSLLYVTWRKFVCNRLHRIYFQDSNYYKLNVLDNTIDNPDQRITQDVDKLCKQFSQVVPELLISPFTIAYYTYQAWKSTGWLGPVSVFVFFVVSTVVNKLLMSPIVNLVVQQEKNEGNFRFKHMQIRANAESAAFYKADRVEEARTNQKLDLLLDIQARLMNREYLLHFSINFIDYIGSILSYVVLAIPIFAGVYDDLNSADLSALISQTAFVCIYLIFSFTRLIDQSVKLTDIAGTAHRIGELIEVIQRVEKPNTINSSSSSGFDSSATAESLMDKSVTCMEHVRLAYKLENVSYAPPNDDKLLVKGLNMQIMGGVNILVTGDSSCGKTSLMRILAGLWNSASGKVEQMIKIGPSGMLFLPQKPFLSDGSLRQQIIYPFKDSYAGTGSEEDAKILEYLNLVDMTTLLERTEGLDTYQEWNWYDVLSPGEMQRLSFVRLFFHSPMFAVLDEATSAVSANMEKTLYATCRQLGITLVSVGHRASVRQYHDVELNLDGTGGWKMDPIKTESPSEQELSNHL